MQNLLSSITSEIFEFSINPNLNTYIYNKEFLLFLSKSNRFINGDFISCININNIFIPPSLRSKGLFKSLISFMINNLQKDIYIENVSNIYLQHFFDNNKNWNKIPSFEYKYTNQKLERIHYDYYYIKTFM